jgi:hypothetical protein
MVRHLGATSTDEHYGTITPITTMTTTMVTTTRPVQDRALAGLSPSALSYHSSFSSPYSVFAAGEEDGTHTCIILTGIEMLWLVIKVPWLL